MGVTNWKRLYTDASIMLDKYQNEVVPKLREQLEKRVEVVRCKDCVRCTEIGLPRCRMTGRNVTDDDFCSRGERRTNE